MTSPAMTWIILHPPCERISQTLREALGGSSGPLYAVLFLRAAKELENREKDEAPGRTVGSSVSCRLPRHERSRRSQKGDRTMMDAIWPAAEAFAAAVKAGRNGQPGLGKSCQRGERGRSSNKADGSPARALKLPRSARSGPCRPGSSCCGNLARSSAGMMEHFA